MYAWLYSSLNVYIQVFFLGETEELRQQRGLRYILVAGSPKACSAAARLAQNAKSLTFATILSTLKGT